jgi:hypothetical protein
MKRAHMKLCVDPNGSISSFAVFASFILDPLSLAPFPWYPIFSNAPPVSWLTPFLDDLDRSSLLLVCRKTQGFSSLDGQIWTGRWAIFEKGSQTHNFAP